MAITNSDLNDLLDAVRSGGDVDVVRRSVEMLLQALIILCVSAEGLWTWTRHPRQPCATDHQPVT